MATTQSPRTPIKPADLNAPFFNIREVAWLWSCSVDTVRRAIKAGLLPCSQHKKGGIILVSQDDLKAYHEATRIVAIPRRAYRRQPARARAAA
ncbi:helix-turn-helix domain-containing protein [Streptomyces sp. NPDC001544]|uniref:helix-turn-helix domain-containing protein n=1 Tax=Streptomyces sp. NPDC001544 TaxID=3364584 RepID=UPI0036BBDA71